MIFKKYSLMGGLDDFAAQFCETLSKSCLYSVSPVTRFSPSSTNSTSPSTSPSEIIGAATAARNLSPDSRFFLGGSKKIGEIMIDRIRETYYHQGRE